MIRPILIYGAKTGAEANKTRLMMRATEINILRSITKETTIYKVRKHSERRVYQICREKKKRLK